MIDMHFHCLPGIDDGPATWEEAVALCRAAAAEGTTDVVATPHVLRDPWLNESPGERAALVARLNELLGGTPRVYSGAEVWFADDLPELWERGSAGPLTALAGGTHLLVELPAHEIPRNARAVLHELLVAGVTPVLAHPERNRAFAADLDQLESLVERGVRTQITAASLAGRFGEKAEAAAVAMIERGLVHAVASDAHSMTRRPPMLRPARERVEQQWGEAVGEMLFEENPRRFAGIPVGMGTELARLS